MEQSLHFQKMMHSESFCFYIPNTYLYYMYIRVAQILYENAKVVAVSFGQNLKFQLYTLKKIYTNFQHNRLRFRGRAPLILEKFSLHLNFQFFKK